MADEQRWCSGVELAREFYRRYEIDFQRAAGATETIERQFEFSPDQFDDWAVALGCMWSAVRKVPETEQGSLIKQRHLVRGRLNRAARRGDGPARAFTIEALAGKWRVLLLERYVQEQPSSIVGGIRQCLERSERTVESVRKFLAAQEHIGEDDRVRCMMRLELAEMSIFNGLQMMEVVMAGFASDGAPNLRRLRRRMATALIKELERQQAAPRKRVAAKKKA